MYIDLTGFNGEWFVNGQEIRQLQYGDDITWLSLSDLTHALGGSTLTGAISSLGKSTIYEWTAVIPVPDSKARIYITLSTANINALIISFPDKDHADMSYHFEIADTYTGWHGAFFGSSQNYDIMIDMDYFCSLMCEKGYLSPLLKKNQQNGNSLVRINGRDYFWPVPASRSAPHGFRPNKNGIAMLAYYHYIGNTNEKDAADLMAPEGSLVYAITTGTIKNVKQNKTSKGGAQGYLAVECKIPKSQQTDEQIENAMAENRASRDSFILAGDDGYTYYYTHLQPLSTNGISTGKRVNAGEYVAKVGNNAAADYRGSHLHISAVPTGYEADSPYGDFYLARDILPVLFSNR